MIGTILNRSYLIKIMETKSAISGGSGDKEDSQAICSLPLSVLDVRKLFS